MKSLVLLLALLAPAQDKAGAVAVVNGDVITRWDLERILRAHPGYRELQRSYQGETFRRQALPLEKEVLGILIQQKLIEQQISKQKVTLERGDEAEVERVHRLSIAKYGSEEMYRMALQQSGMTVEDDIEGIKLKVLLDKLLREEFGPEPFVSPKEIREAYSKFGEEVAEKGYLDGMLGELCVKGSLKVRQIKLPSDARAEAEAIHAKAAAGEEFGALATAHSKGPRADRGGLWEFEGPDAPFTQRRAEAIRALQPGGVSPLVEDRGAIYIIKLEERSRPRLKPYVEVRQVLHRVIAAQKRGAERQKWFKDLLNSAHVVNYLEAEAPP